jgi:hypothetical protein
MYPYSSVYFTVERLSVRRAASVGAPVCWLLF